MTKAAKRHDSGTFASASPGAAQTSIGRIVAYRDDAQYPIAISLTAGDSPIPARVASNLSRRDLDAAVAGTQSAILVFENGDARLPIVVGLLGAPALAPVEADVGADEVGRSPKVVEADVDGKRVRITGHDEIVFECGKASITLRRNGRIVVRGAYVETYATGTNRIKGGQVRIN